jgi:sugar O-acyltransferase (sialic acid O-acetyltransferase NeuD family)
MVRKETFILAKAKGYNLVSFISPYATVLNDGCIGDNCFIFEGNIIQPFVRIGHNVTLWSGNHIGHQSVVHDNCFISSHVVISGYCEVGENCFLGVNSCVADHITVGRDCVIGAGAVVAKDADNEMVYRGNPAEASKVSSLKLFKVRGA